MSEIKATDRCTMSESLFWHKLIKMLITWHYASNNKPVNMYRRDRQVHSISGVATYLSMFLGKQQLYQLTRPESLPQGNTELHSVH